MGDHELAAAGRFTGAKWMPRLHFFICPPPHVTVVIYGNNIHRNIGGKRRGMRNGRPGSMFTLPVWLWETGVWVLCVCVCVCVCVGGALSPGADWRRWFIWGFFLSHWALAFIRGFAQVNSNPPRPSWPSSHSSQHGLSCTRRCCDCCLY